jgi:lysosomal alpha-mannosidase
LISQNITWPTKYDDMFPYADSPQEYWTGYFTSRANSKKQIRDGQANLHASSKLYSYQVISQNTTDAEIANITTVRDSMFDAMGINQHHDAISGTAKQYVADDYARRLFQSMQINNNVTSPILTSIMNVHSGITTDQWLWCTAMNGTYNDCPIADNQTGTHLVSVHNPSLIDIPYLKMKVSHGNYQVYYVNMTTTQTELVSAAVICAPRLLDNGTLVEDCDMHVNATVPANHLSFFLVEYNTTVNITVNATETLAINSNYE